MIPTDARNVSFSVSAANVDGGDPVGVQMTLTSITGDRGEVLEVVQIGLRAMAAEIAARYPGHLFDLAAQWAVDGFESIEYP